ncbi:MBL fold metallo-hydrolase [Bacillus aquiflavi]|uniref:YtnP family quorum-quenching lactonase n=1 Tax=Bacillus aquiflavi TaxID=2672567 RepID=UPI001CA83859|nr:MBL fold metallo-hydrolase [Bacillus aquiflavi]UAC47594.1 MBL fold metallo-hydrolase [Bacillus aquiflavi]
MEKLTIGKIKLTWLNGGVTHLDGGAMFGVVPKPLWTKKYPHNENNQIELRTDPILIQYEGINFLMETGIGKGKMNDKQKRNFCVTEESSVETSLIKLGLSPSDIDYVIMTHMHFDHACGLTKLHNGEYVSVFPNAKIITSVVEWNEMRHPNIRSQNTYWRENWEAVEGQVESFEREWSFKDKIKMIHTGGHSDGHSVVIIQDEDETAVHMADLMPTHAHNNVLWVMAYDDYPMDSIKGKKKWMEYGLKQSAWFTFYHDAYYRAIKWDHDGKIIEDHIKRVRP